MGAQLNRETYERLIAENIAWLMTCPPTLERDHILLVLQCSADREYGTADIAARADARIAELERNIERLDAQWRDELRIYRETDGARIAELEAALRRVRRWCMGSGYSASVQVAMKEWIDGGMVGGMPELTGLEAAIDAACVNGGGM